MEKFPLKYFIKSSRKCKLGYKVRYLGCLPCSHPGEDEICRAMNELYAVKKQDMDKLPWFDINVLSRSITLREISSVGQQEKLFFIKKIVYSAVNRRHSTIFAFFYTSPDNMHGGLDCHVFKCQKKADAKRVALKLSEAFHEMCSADRDGNTECDGSQQDVNIAEKRSMSLIPLQISLESLPADNTADDCLQKTNKVRRRLDYSELQSTPEMDAVDSTWSILNGNGDQAHSSSSPQAKKINHDYINGEIMRRSTAIKNGREVAAKRKERRPVPNYMFNYEYMTCNLPERNKKYDSASKT